MPTPTPAANATPMNATFTTLGVTKAEDSQRLVTNGSSDPDDSYEGLYMGSDIAGSTAILEPPFKPATLRNLTTTNNTLLQCIAAMEVSIDGTGYTIEPVITEVEEGKSSGSDKSPSKAALVDFFDEPYPGKSMIAMRREIRNDMESTGNGYMEVIRNAADEILMINSLSAVDMRLLRLDEPVIVDRSLIRKGRKVSVKVRARERRFVQRINNQNVFFKEFGASRDLDRTTGQWAPEGTRLGIQNRASEVVHFKVLSDPKSPYGLPRWINQLPSVLGSRKAEEFNLDFFDSGGLPPLLVVVSGGYLADGVKDSLAAHLGGKGSKHRAAVVEAISSSGSLDSTGSVKVTVERFGAERQQDSMFQQYDKNAEEHVRTSFRLPPMFIGRAQDYNFATAMTGFMVAEAQVFATERLQFDETMWWIISAMGHTDYTYKSKPMSLTHAENQLKALELANTGDFAEKEDVLQALNSLTGLTLKYKEPTPPPEPPALGQPVSEDEPTIASDPPKVVQKKDPSRVTELLELADQWANVLGLSGQTVPSDSQRDQIVSKVGALHGEELKVFTSAIATMSLASPRHDLDGLSELCGAAFQRV